MKNFVSIFNVNKFLSKLLLVIIVYAFFSLIDIQEKIGRYNKEINYYTSQKEELLAKKEELLATKENVNSEEYIEEIARKQLDMFLPNETVYVEIGK